jgi:hypothetical protein
VDIAVNDRHPPDQRFAHQRPRRDSDVVEHAIAFAAIAKRVMSAAGEVGGDARDQRCARRRDRRPNRPPRTFDHLR